MPTNPDVDAYISRSQQWPEEMAALRPILLRAGLTEQIKWRTPCYSHGGRNIAIVQEMKEFLALMFFKGALLADPDGVLEDQGPNSRSARRIRFTSVDDVARLSGTVEAYLAEAVDVEEAGLAVGPAPDVELVEELQRRLDRDPALRDAFEGLTPGRQREYHLHVSAAKQAATREARVEKCAPKILVGKGLRDR
ncbi:MAG: YdeI/OmpD-associated family protein [Ilumatobacter sp.]|uniref:YdeI/OmpD-associated family protein n=1 Tax=Ilumatobacter sp. TaxID=1967498 RepID=UPI002618B6F1|nr:YdeI/OmpD-associated family protein [Ilumatobacter sp.]MDJ0770349.1 YdeI/OmpD-associated family protein [Ilumatobacter sp.]